MSGREADCSCSSSSLRYDRADVPCSAADYARICRAQTELQVSMDAGRSYDLPAPSSQSISSWSAALWIIGAAAAMIKSPVRIARTHGCSSSQRVRSRSGFAAHRVRLRLRRAAVRRAAPQDCAAQLAQHSRRPLERGGNARLRKAIFCGIRIFFLLRYETGNNFFPRLD